MVIDASKPKDADYNRHDNMDLSKPRQNTLTLPMSKSNMICHKLLLT